MNSATRHRVAAILSDFAMTQLPKLTKWDLADIRRAYPFHRLFFPDEAILAARVERSVVTVMGSSLYPLLAKAIGSGRFVDVQTNHVIEGVVNDAANNMIEQIVTELRTPPRRRKSPRHPNRESELLDILSSRGGGPSPRAVTADLFIGDYIDGPLFIELKSPMPNLDIAAESKRKMLYFLAIMSRRGVNGAQAFLGFPYNPYVTRGDYKHSFTRQIMDMEAEVLMGEELWDFIGGKGTYAELLSIIDQVRERLPRS